MGKSTGSKAVTRKRIYTLEQKQRAKELQKIRDARRTPESKLQHAEARRLAKLTWPPERWERERARDRARDEKRRDKQRVTLANWREENREHHDAYQREYQLKHAERKAQYQRNRRANLSPEKGAAQTEWKRLEYRRRKSDPLYILIKRQRNRIYYALQGGKKQGSTLSLLGCTAQRLKEHLEGQFQAGMSWTNYGLWHVDHIVPLASFDNLVHDPEQQRSAFHYTNLQPLWGPENLAKGARTDWVPSSLAHSFSNNNELLNPILAVEE